tara:strand:+ start:280 stop:411 length:132 start_codon:yes stop_codon:yes gene_type:complete
MDISEWMHKKGVTVKDLFLAAFAMIPLVAFTGLLLYGLIGSLL